MERQSTPTLKVQVHQITSVTDRDTGRPGKNITLIAVKQQSQRPPYASGFGGSDDPSAMIRNIVSGLQQSGLPFVTDITQPKFNLFLTESEYDLLGVRFEVNEVYDVVLKDGTIRFHKPLEGV
jgi:hypothetical protein